MFWFLFIKLTSQPKIGVVTYNPYSSFDFRTETYEPLVWVVINPSIKTSSSLNSNSGVTGSIHFWNKIKLKTTNGDLNNRKKKSSKLL